MAGLNRREAIGYMIKGTSALAVESVLLNLRGSKNQSVTKREGQVTVGSNDSEFPLPLDLTSFPTAAKIKSNLPEILHPEFIFLEYDKKINDIPSFVVVGPLTLSRVVGDRTSYTPPLGEASVGQKYIEFAPVDSSVANHKPWVSFSAYLPDDIYPLEKFRNDHIPQDNYAIIFPILPPAEWRKMAISVYERVRSLSPSQAAELDKSALLSSAVALSGNDADFYLTTFSTDYIMPLK